MRRLVPAPLRPTVLVPPKTHTQAQIKHMGGVCCLLRGLLSVLIHISDTFCGSWGVLAAPGDLLNAIAALEAFGGTQ